MKGNYKLIIHFNKYKIILLRSIEVMENEKYPMVDTTVKEKPQQKRSVPKKEKETTNKTAQEPKRQKHNTQVRTFKNKKTNPGKPKA